MRIAVLANDNSQSTLLCDVLGHAGHHCHALANDKELLIHLHRENYDLLVMEAPHDIDVNAFVSAIREDAVRDMPILILAKRTEEDAIIAALSAGVGDYIVKPVRNGELVLRAHILLQRAYPERDMAETIAFRQYVFGARTGTVAMAGQPIEVTRKEFELALLFFRNLGRPLSRAYISESVWGHDADMPSRTLDTHVSRVRNKLALSPENGFRLAPVYSYGYRLEQIAD